MIRTNHSAKIKNKSEYLVQLILQKYDIKMPDFAISVDLRGNDGGKAYHREGEYGIRLNVEMVNRHLDYLLEVVLPHEIAHLVCYVTGDGAGHDATWRGVCVGLGGTGEVTHDIPLTGKIHGIFSYVTTTGRIVALTQVRHNHVQRGSTLICKDGGKIHSICDWSMA